MLTIVEAAAVYPPSGEVPNLDNDDVNYGLIAKRLGIRAGGDIALETWYRLILWSRDPTPRTFVTWAAAVSAATGGPSRADGTRTDEAVMPTRAGCGPR